MDDNKSKALNAALSQIEKQFGKNTVMRLGDNTVQAVEALSLIHISEPTRPSHISRMPSSA